MSRADIECSHATAAGTMAIAMPASTVITSRITGVFEAILIEQFMRSFDQAVADAPPGVRYKVFHDWEEMTDYDMAGRIKLTTWTVKNRAAFETVEFYLTSSVVAFGVQVANVIVGNFMRVHRDRASFESSLREAVGSASTRA
jgi:hypothetical protein